MPRPRLDSDCNISAALPDQPQETPHLVIAVRGDGTVNRVINRYDPESLWLGVLPLGSANDLATSLARFRPGVECSAGGTLRGDRSARCERCEIRDLWGFGIRDRRGRASGALDVR